MTYPLAQTAGNLNVVVVGWNDTTSTVTSVVDSRGNSYTLAIGPTTGTGLRQSVYYAKNIVGGSNTVTVTFSQAAFFVDVRVLEYSGLDTGDAAGCDGGSGGDRGEREQRGGDDDVGERVDFRGGDDGGDVWRIGDGVCDPDHHAGFGHRAGQDGEQHGELQCVGDADLLLALGDADGDVPGGALIVRQRF